MQYLVDLNRDKILSHRDPDASHEHKSWKRWLREGRAVLLDSDIIPQVAAYSGGIIVEDPQKRARYDADQADIAELNALQMSGITTATLVVVVKLVVRVLKSQL